MTDKKPNPYSMQAVIERYLADEAFDNDNLEWANEQTELLVAVLKAHNALLYTLGELADCIQLYMAHDDLLTSDIAYKALSDLIRQVQAVVQDEKALCGALQGA